VDNSIHSFGFDLDNGVPIQSFIYNSSEEPSSSSDQAVFDNPTNRNITHKEGPRRKSSRRELQPQTLKFDYTGVSQGDEDRELLYLMSFLEDLVYVNDVRVPIRDAFKMSYL